MPPVLGTRYQAGDAVRVRVGLTPGHNRTPEYVQGKAGTVLRCFGRFLNPEAMAYGGSGLPEVALYQVEFDQSQIWNGYLGPARDRLWIDIYEHWLEPV